MMNREEFLDLYEKLLSGNASEAEIQRLKYFKDEIRLSDEVWEDNNSSEQEVYTRIWEKLERSRRVPFRTKKNLHLSWLSAAAILLIGCTVCWLFTKRKVSPRLMSTNALPHHHQPVRPGENKAVLTLANGSEITLTAASNGELARQAGSQVTKVKDGILTYKSVTALKAQAVGKELRPAAMNTITVPRGGQYQLVLNDGTTVWLNAASVLKYPASFSGGERRVQLTGEAYFEVHKNPAAPFVVQTASEEVRVLGTHFNINAYTDTKVVKTSLLEGKVDIIYEGTKTSLSPGQQATSNLNGRISVANADVLQSIAWKNGLFQFHDATVEEVMQQLSRWYDVNVVYLGKPPMKQFSGTVSRQAQLMEVLTMLNYTGVHVRLRQNELVVSP